METLRKKVTNKKTQVWTLRNNQDLYTKKTKTDVEKNSPQVDHILEIQLLDKVFNDAWNEAPVAARTREGHKQFAQIVNAVDTLNVTTRNVNMVKMGATKAFLNRANSDRLRSKSLEECFAKEHRDSGLSNNIGNAVVMTYDDYIHSEIGRVVKNQGLADALVDNLSAMIGKMEIG